MKELDGEKLGARKRDANTDFEDVWAATLREQMHDKRHSKSFCGEDGGDDGDDNDDGDDDDNGDDDDDGNDDDDGDGDDDDRKEKSKGAPAFAAFNKSKCVRTSTALSGQTSAVVVNPTPVQATTSRSSIPQTTSSIPPVAPSSSVSIAATVSSLAPEATSSPVFIAAETPVPLTVVSSPTPTPATTSAPLTFPNSTLSPTSTFFSSSLFIVTQPSAVAASSKFLVPQSQVLPTSAEQSLPQQSTYPGLTQSSPPSSPITTPYNFYPSSVPTATSGSGQGSSTQTAFGASKETSDASPGFRKDISSSTKNGLIGFGVIGTLYVLSPVFKLERQQADNTGVQLHYCWWRSLPGSSSAVDRRKIATTKSMPTTT
jgi:hypothetical protein